ncbi:MAG: AAA family ATPase [Desulfosarcinaceae bacterium]|nr:AAA family ATPase [Desulfosarcinaceae bacterium]
MYNAYFGFKEKPFKLVPNPAFLYLGKCHEDALAHLTYATNEGDGFVEISGEVGTGKTTLCRVFLENLNANTESAYIFNPRLESLQLLRTINSEFGIRNRSPHATLKDHLDDLNAFLIKKRTDGKRILLFIDEAQNLSTANLELIRMLSNLETTRSKLLQIVLVGQPELSEKLERHDLRQLRQRINLTCYLVPLSRRETRAYVEHRIGIAAQKQLNLFTAAAHRAIFNYSEGVPRRINIVCDRALLATYSTNQKRVTLSTVRTVVKELQAQLPARRTRARVNVPTWAPLLGVLLLLLLMLQLVLQVQYARKFSSVQGGLASATAEAKRFPINDPAVLAPPPHAAPDAAIEHTWPEVIAAIDPRQSRHDSLVELLNLWQISAGQIITDFGTGDAASFFRLSALRYDLQVQTIDGDLALVRRLNRPAIVALQRPDGPDPGFAVLVAISDNRATLRGGGAEAPWEVEVTIPELMAQLSGPIHLFWKDFLSDPGTIPVSSAPETVIALKLLLRDMGHTEIVIAPVYDELTEQVVRQVQLKYGLKVDGLVGPMTKICLYNDNPKLWQPSLSS